jgi:cytosine/adenosine deaminase-related metal-dependent hydrolase
LAHGIHFDDEAVQRLADTRTGVAHCPSSNARLGAGICRTRDLLDVGVPVGLGVDGAASNEAASLVEELRHAVLFARARGGPTALSVRQALELATIGGAEVLGWDDQIGSIETGKLADLALWRLDTIAHADIDDPVAALVLGSAPPLELLLVQGSPVVRHDELVTVDEAAVARDVQAASTALLSRAGVTS